MIRCWISKVIRDNKTNMSLSGQLFAIFEQVKLLTQRKDAVYAELKRGLETQGVEICSYSELGKTGCGISGFLF